MATNSEIDTLAGAIPAGSAGPWTRVTDMDALGIDPNERIRIEFTTVNSFPVFATFIQLNNADVVERLGLQAQGFTTKVNGIKTKVDTLDTTMAGYSAPHTYAEYKATIASLRNINEIDNV